MLKIAIYCNVFILLAMSVLFRTEIKTNNDNFKKIIERYILYNIISIYLCSSEIVDIGWDNIYLLPFSIISLIIFIANIFCINRKRKKSNNTDFNNLSQKKYITLSMLPVIVFLIPYLYELFVINNCNYLLHYNYQSGIIQSDNTYIAILNNKPLTITLQRNLFDLFNMKGTESNVLDYDIIYANGIDRKNIEISMRDSNYDKIITKNKNIEKIAINAKEKHPSAKGASLKYFPEGKYAIITLHSRETSGTILGEYFYYDSNYIQRINTNGSLETITYYP